MNMSVERQRIANQPDHDTFFPQKKTDSETVCLRLLIKGLIVPIRLCILSIAYY